MASVTLNTGPEAGFAERSPRVAVVITTFNDATFLTSAIESALQQEHPADEIFLVDDGSEQSPAPLLKRFPQVTLLTKPQGGPSSARNFGLRHATSEFITFLDADDRYEPVALREGLACFRVHPEAAMVYGAHRRIRSDGRPITGKLYKPLGADPYASFLRGNLIGMPATVLYRRDVLLEIGGFDETSRYCEDYDLCLRVAQAYPIASHESIVAEYRWHGDNVSANTEKMLEGGLKVHGRHADQTGERLEAWKEGHEALIRWYKVEQPIAWGSGKEPKGLHKFAERLRAAKARAEKMLFRSRTSSS